MSMFNKLLYVLGALGVAFAIVVVVTISLYVNKQFNKKPSTNSPESRSLHGVKKGQENTFSIRGNVYTIPSEIEIEVSTAGEIVSGQADVLTLYYDVSHLPQIKARWPQRRNIVRIELHYIRTFDRPVKDLYKESWDEIIEHPDKGLTEFKKESPSGYGKSVYQTKDKLDDYPQAKVVTFNCPGGHYCSTAAQYKNDIRIWVYIPDHLRPHMRSIYNEIYTKVDSFNKD